MKQLLMLVCCFLLCSFLGCQQNRIFKISDSVESGEDPVAGIWRSHEAGWVLYLGADGNMPEVYRPEGLHMVLSEESSERISPDTKLFVQYTYGNCFWSYDTGANNLKATVTLDNYYVNADGVELSLGMVDEFEGPVSSDKKTWTANWITITTFDDANIPEQISTGRTLIFNKMP